MGVMMLLIFVNVIMCYLFNDNIFWVFEGIVFMFVWMVFVGVLFGVKCYFYIGVDVLINIVLV